MRIKQIRGFDLLKPYGSWGGAQSVSPDHGPQNTTPDDMFSEKRPQNFSGLDDADSTRRDSSSFFSSILKHPEYGFPGNLPLWGCQYTRKSFSAKGLFPFLQKRVSSLRTTCAYCRFRVADTHA